MQDHSDNKSESAPHGEDEGKHPPSIERDGLGAHANHSAKMITDEAPEHGGHISEDGDVDDEKKESVTDEKQVAAEDDESVDPKSKSYPQHELTGDVS